MNKIYQVIWNVQLACWQVASELAKKHQSSSRSNPSAVENKRNFNQKIGTFLAFSLTVLPLSIHAAIQNNALPTGGTVTAGTAHIVQNGNTLNINQNSQNLSSNWNTFNIGQDATVNFNQPNQSSVALNHVLDPNASQIMGRLNANGQVFLLNPNGVVFSKTAQVNVGGIVASTLNITDQDLQKGQYTLKGDVNSTASVENHGTIKTLAGGAVALIAPNVVNSGNISTPGGTAHLTAASQVTLALQDGSLTQYQVGQGVLQGLVDNGGAIIADNGAVYLTAKAKDSLSKAVVNHSGIIEANRFTQNAKGEIILLGDMNSGTTQVSGSLKAEGRNGQDGGFIETSAAKVKIADSTQVSTRSEGGKTGTWLIDPTDFTVAASGGDMTGLAVSNALAANNFTILSTNGAQGINGDIHVNDTVSWNQNTLTLNAQNNININTAMNGSGTAGLALKYGQVNLETGNTSTYNVNAPVNLASTGSFSTQLGSDGLVKNYTIITDLGAQGSTTATDLQGIAGNLADNYVLGANIDAAATSGWNAGAGFNPLGDNSTPFSGKFDGLGHTISNLTINRPFTDYVGLFGQTNDADIHNVGLINSNVSGNNYVGGLVGYNWGSTINTAYNTGSVIGNVRVGGLVGHNLGDIENSYNTGPVTGTSSVGGLAGVHNSLMINNSYSTGIVTGIVNVGGLVGQSVSGVIKNAYSTGAVIGQGSLGGLVGYNNFNVLISNAYATGAVTGNVFVGGLIGYNQQSTISNAYATGAVAGNDYVGGLVGINHYSSISNAYATGSVTGNNYVGGLVGDNNSGIISNAYWNTETTGQLASAGGIGLTSAQMLLANSFVGFDIDDQGGTGKVWRIYEGQANPLLRSFLTPLTIAGDNTTATYNGLSQGGGYQVVPVNAVYDPTLILSNHKNATATAVTINLDQDLYSLQQGYDLIIQAGNETGSLTINKAQATVTANSLNTTYNGLNQTASGFTVAGLVNGETAAELENVSASVTGKNAGSYSNIATGTDNNYALTFVDGSLNIAKALATVTANSLQTVFNGQNQTVSGFTATGLVNGETEAVLTDVSASVTAKKVGHYINHASGTDNNYELIFVDGALDIIAKQNSKPPKPPKDPKPPKIY